MLMFLLAAMAAAILCSLVMFSSGEGMGRQRAGGGAAAGQADGSTEAP